MYIGVLGFPSFCMSTIVCMWVSVYISHGFHIGLYINIPSKALDTKVYFGVFWYFWHSRPAFLDEERVIREAVAEQEYDSQDWGYFVDAANKNKGLRKNRAHNYCIPRFIALWCSITPWHGSSTTPKNYLGSVALNNKI